MAKRSYTKRNKNKSQTQNQKSKRRRERVLNDINRREK